MQILFDILRGEYYRNQRKIQSSLSLSKNWDNQSSPRVLWIGCSDIYLSPYLATGLEPGQIVMHHNIANQIKPEDASVQSVIQHAVESLSVSSIVVCGHYQCSSIRTALQEAEDESAGETPISVWIQDLRELAFRHWSSLHTISSIKERSHRLAELNVLAQAEKLRYNKFVKARKNSVQVLSWIFDSEKGKFSELSAIQVIERQVIASR